DISGAQKLVGQWDFWLDMTETSGDGFDIFLASNDLQECVTDPAGFVDEDPGWWYGGPYWANRTDDWDAFAGNDWLAIVWDVRQRTDPDPPHWGGIFMNRTKVGIPSGDAGTQFDLDTWSRYNDWYVEQMAEALLDTGRLLVADDDDIVSVEVMASNDAGATWEAYSCRREDIESNWWWTPPPVNQMTPGSRIIYYFEATDGVGNTATYPEEAPNLIYEFSILPINGSTSDPGILLVDKHGRRTPGEDRDYTRTSEYYYREMLGILGYEWDVYDVEVPSGTNEQSHGPDSVAFKYYDTQIWLFNEFNSYTAETFDQNNLINWLQQSGEGKERNLLFTGNDVGYELMEAGTETLSFYETWLATTYLRNAIGSVVVDSLPTLRDHAGGYDFMTHDDGECILTGGCPSVNFFDVIEPRAGVTGNETAVDYVKQDATTDPAGVAYTHQTLGYQTVNLGFGMEFMVDGLGAGGYFNTGIEDRSDFMGNIMDYFGQTPSGPGTGVVGGMKNALSNAYPNPFNPVTKIAYSVKEAGPVAINVYNAAGRVVRTLLDTEVDAGASGYVVWDGTNDGGERCASGVYFYRIAAPGFTTSRKMVMLK
ncbi:MAG TPA: T9SS type A sorting domain-containing protein, partial [bacterium]|nr:T9SS type A sorting domain-containing protein [bacterium]